MRTILLSYLFQGTPVKDPFRRSLTSAMQWLSIVKERVQKLLRAKLNEAHKKLLQDSKLSVNLTSLEVSTPSLPASSITLPPSTVEPLPGAATPPASASTVTTEEKIELLSSGLVLKCPACFAGFWKGDQRYILYV